MAIHCKAGEMGGEECLETGGDSTGQKAQRVKAVALYTQALEGREKEESH